MEIPPPILRPPAPPHRLATRLVGIVTVSDLLELLGRGIDRPAQGRRVTLKARAPREDSKAKRMR